MFIFIKKRLTKIVFPLNRKFLVITGGNKKEIFTSRADLNLNIVKT